MKNFHILCILLTSFLQLNAQVSVFDCSVYTKHLSQTQANAQDTITGTCITLGDNGVIHLNNSNNTTIFAKNEITLKDDVHLGGFDTTGGVHLKITAKAGLEVAVMNYTDLAGVLRYKKLEFGIELPDVIQERIHHFLFEKGVYSDELNPFLEWKVDVEGTFEHVTTGKIVKVDGFYTREYNENHQTDDWDEVPTLYPFRVRFAPPLNGEWKAVISIRIDGVQGTTYLSDDFWFNVVESGDPGYVTVHENKLNLKQGDRMIFPVGTNFPYPMLGSYRGIEFNFIDSVRATFNGDTIYYGHNLAANDMNSEKASNTVHWKQYLDMISEYLKLNRYQGETRYIRTIQYPASSLIEFEEKGNYYKRLHYAYEQDKLLDTMEKYNSLMLFNFMNQVPFFKLDEYGAFDWDWDYDIYKTGPGEDGSLDTSPWVYNKPRYCYNDQPQGQKQPYEALSNDDDLVYHKQRIRYYIARYGYSTKIMEFEILSEPFHVNEQAKVQTSSGQITVQQNRPFGLPSDPLHTPVRQAVLKYHKVLSEYIKDSLQWHNQLIGVDMGWGDITEDIATEALPNIDVIGLNKYYTTPDDIYKMTATIQQRQILSKPILFSEGGLDEKYQECSSYTQHPVDMMTFPFTGVAGYLTWFGWRKGEETLWPATIRAQQHMNGDDVINTLSEGGGNWGHGKQEEKLFLFINSHQTNFSALEHQYYLSNNKNYSVGYVKNRTYNVHTKRLNDYCDLNYGNTEPIDDLENIKWNDVRLLPLNRRLRVQGLSKNTKYRVDYYSFETGNHLSTQCDKTPLLKGELVLKYNELTANPSGNELLNPVIWYVIIKNGCPQGREVEESSDSLTLKSDVLTISTENIEEQLLVFPNPFNNYITIVSNKEDELTIITVDGRISKKVLIPKGNTTIYTADLASGVYILFFARQLVQTKMIKP